MQALLTDVREIVAEARWEELDGALQRIQGTPNNAEPNLREAAYSARPLHLFCTLSLEALAWGKHRPSSMS